MRAAIFDVDRTLLDGMSGFLFAAHLMKTGAMPWRRVLHSARAVTTYRLGLADAGVIVEAGATCLAGLSHERAVELADRVMDRVLRPRLFREALATIDTHRTAGDVVLLASGSNAHLIEAIARAVGATAGIGTSCERDNGRLLPKMSVPPCVAEHKRDLVIQWLEAREMSVADAVCYTDNGIDIPLLEVVGEAVAVNPDPELAAYAQRRGLPIVAWKTPLDAGRRRTGSSFPLRG